MGYEIDQECLSNTAVALGGMVAALWYRYHTRTQK